jgi:hypothetical protein
MVLLVIGAMTGARLALKIVMGTLTVAVRGVPVPSPSSVAVKVTR